MHFLQIIIEYKNEQCKKLIPVNTTFPMFYTNQTIKVHVLKSVMCYEFIPTHKKTQAPATENMWYQIQHQVIISAS